MTTFEILSPDQVEQLEAPKDGRKPRPMASKVRAPHVITLPAGGRSRLERSQPQAAKKNDPKVLEQLGEHLLEVMMRVNGKVPKPAAITDEYLAQEVAHYPGRSLIGPGALPPAQFRKYLQTLAGSALNHSDTSPYPVCGPRTVALLLGGLSFYEVEVLCEEALAELDFEDQEVDPTLSDAMAAVGYGDKLNHHHYDHFLLSQLYPLPAEDKVAYENRLKRLRKGAVHNHRLFSHRRLWLAESTEGPFADYLACNSGYGADLAPRIKRMKPAVMIDAYQALNMDSPLIQEESAKRIKRDYGVEHWTNSTHPTNEQFAQAVRMVFEGKWSKLALTGDPGQDMPKVMARLIIRQLCVSAQVRLREPVQINARCLIGMSLLTGIPTGKFVQFAIEDQRRRGETFMSRETVEQVLELVDTSGVFQKAQAEWMEELTQLGIELEAEKKPAEAYWAQKLRALSYPLFSPESYYNVVKLTNEGTDFEVGKYVPRRDLKMAMYTLKDKDD